jgi:peptidase M50B-like protein
VLSNGGLIFLVLRYGNVEIETIAAYALSWFLLLSGVRFVLMPDSWAGDSETLSRTTHIPRVVWIAFWLAGAVLALWIGGHLLV